MATVLTSRADDFPRWYADVVTKAELAENGPVRGTQIIRPWGYAIWERMQAELDARIKAAGAHNVAFPVFLPESALRREAEHVDGFSPEVATVTHAGGNHLDEPVVVRPTSETLFGEYLARWVQGYRDLPVLLNQWGNAVRWEMRPRLFLRSSEFLWQEGHTAHATAAEASAYARRILREVYEDMMTRVLAIPVITGRKTTAERFPGAVTTTTLEAMMGDGKALQMGTSHEFGQNFARAFGIDFLDQDGARRLAWTTSWGASTRMVGGLIMCHGDDAGLRLPPRLAATQVVVLSVRPEAVERCQAVAAELRDAGVRTEVDVATDRPFGRRAVDWELKGVPVRVELGPRDLAADTATLVRRVPGNKQTVPTDGLARAVVDALDADQQALYAEAVARRDARITDAQTVDEAAEACADGWARVPWDALGVDGERRLAEHGVTVRCLTRANGSLPDGDDEPDLFAYTARAY